MLRRGLMLIAGDTKMDRATQSVEMHWKKGKQERLPLRGYRNRNGHWQKTSWPAFSILTVKEKTLLQTIDITFRNLSARSSA